MSFEDIDVLAAKITSFLSSSSIGNDKFSYKLKLKIF